MKPEDIVKQKEREIIDDIVAIASKLEQIKSIDEVAFTKALAMVKEYFNDRF